MKRRKSVALLIETSNAYARGILEGIVEHQRTRDSWSIYLPELERGATPPAWLHDWKGDGIIARIENERIAEVVRSLKVPLVDVSAARRVPNVPWIETDDRRIAELAFDHLRERGFRRFAFCGPKGFNWSNWREEAFRQCCEKNDVPCEVFQTSVDHSTGFVGDRPVMSNQASSTQPKLQHWINELEKPVGMFCAYDIQAQVVLDVCRNLAIAVPEQIAVVGVDNDPLLCNLTHPSLTSVAPDARGAGLFAAELLDQMMDQSPGESMPIESRLLEPLGVIARQSTDITSVNDPDVADAVRYIRDYACEGIDVGDVMKRIPVSRRRLESKFLQEIGKTPHELITTIRMQRVAKLLRESDLSMEEIAEQTGFENPEYLSVVFKRHFQITPGRYRRNRL